MLLEKHIINILPPDLAWKYKVVPVSFINNTIEVIIDEKAFYKNIQGELELITGYSVKITTKKTEIISELLSKYYRHTNTHAINETVDTSNTDDFLQKIVLEAKKLGSSDIHIETYSEKCRIRLRIDGKLIERYSLHKHDYSSFVNKIKIKSRLDIAEKRLPQDGRILIVDSTEKIDLRVSVLPSLYGEKIVLRILSTDSSHISIDNLGLDENQLSDFTNTLKKPHGIILISGPTGSGKTTTLYATLKLLNNEYSNILTIEDPIEYTLDGVNQVQVKENIGFTFSSALRTFLRQDPDIIMLGEIRDAETAQMAVRAALTGHLVLSTIHTNSAWGTVSRLIDMGVPTFLLANTLNMTIAQRLIRKLCNYCKRKENSVDNYLYKEIVKKQPLTHVHYLPTGCKECYYTGYSGRIAIYEVIPIDTEISLMIKENVHSIDNIISIRKIKSLKNRAIELISQGHTSIEEVYPILLNY